MCVFVRVCVRLELRLNQIKYLRCRWNCLHDANVSQSKRVLTSLTRTNGSRPLISSMSWFSWISYAWCPRAEEPLFYQNGGGSPASASARLVDMQTFLSTTARIFHQVFTDSYDDVTKFVNI